MKPIMVLQNEVVMFYVERILGNKNSIGFPIDIKLNKSRNLQRCEKLKNSINLYYNNADAQNFLEDVSNSVEVFESFVQSLLNGQLRDLKGKIASGDSAALWEGIVNFQSAQDAVDTFFRIEKKVKAACVDDWNKHITDFDSWIDGSGEGETYSFILQAVRSFNLFWCLKGPAVSTSLYTNELPYTYQNRTAGFIYKLTPENLITLATSDSNSRVELLRNDRSCLESVLNWSYLEDSYDVIFTDDCGSSYYTYDSFVSKCLKRTLNVAHKDDWYNEVLLKPDFVNDVAGVFYCESSPNLLIEQATMVAKSCHLPLVSRSDGGILKVRYV